MSFIIQVFPCLLELHLFYFFTVGTESQGAGENGRQDHVKS